MYAIYMVGYNGLRPVHADADSAEGFRELISMLGCGGRGMVRRVEDGIRTAISKGQSTVMVCGSECSEFGVLISIRAAREAHQAVITATDLDKPTHALRWPMLTDMFGITRAEAEIAIALFEGEDLDAIAEYRHVALETVRGQVKSLLRKLGVHNQRRLASMLSCVALALPKPDFSPVWGITAPGAEHTAVA